MARFVASALAGDDDVPRPLEDEDRVARFLLVVAGLAVRALLAMMHTHRGGGNLHVLQEAGTLPVRDG